MARTTLTYSWLARKCMSLRRRSPEEFDNVATTGSSAVVRGLLVRWSLDGHCSPFTLKTPSGDSFAEVQSAEVDGTDYTLILPTFTPSTYKKRLVSKYLPVELPMGVKCRARTPCRFLDADGSVSYDGQWHGGRRGTPGQPSMYLVLRDSSGAFIWDRNLAGRVVHHTHLSEPLMRMGWFPDASPSRKAWLESIAAIPGDLADHGLMLKCAARAYLAAHKICSLFPECRMALFPAQVWPNGRDVRRHGWLASPALTLGYPASGHCTYLPPEVCVYWPVTTGQHTHYVDLTMIVPPHGSPGLDPRGKPGMLYANAKRERKTRWAYHDLRAFDPSVPIDNRDDRLVYFMYMHGEQSVAGEAQRVFWPDHTDKVVVRSSVSTYYTVTDRVPPMLCDPVAMTPDAVPNFLQEHLMLESMPLC